MIIFINGSINSGKSTAGRILAKELEFEFVEFDDIRSTIPEPDIDKALPRVFEKGIELLNRLHKSNKSVIVAYPLSLKNYNLLKSKLLITPKVITLSPRLEVALKDRGERKLEESERERIKYHYKIGINKPSFGDIIDNSDISIKETVDKAREIINNYEME
jgi:dephospho-CoA kinase